MVSLLASLGFHCDIFAFCKYWGWKWTYLMKKILICIYIVLDDTRKTYFFS